MLKPKQMSMAQAIEASISCQDCALHGEQLALVNECDACLAAIEEDGDGAAYYDEHSVAILRHPGGAVVLEQDADTSGHG